MAYEALVLADSISPLEKRLTTMQVTLPRFVLAEYNTHRVFSRNSASSRAIPVEKQIQKILDDPAMPIYWGKNQPGMKAQEELSPQDKALAEQTWLIQRDYAVLGAVALNGGVDNLKNAALRDRIAEIQLYKPQLTPLNDPAHKQVVNRGLEPYMWQTIITTATEWDNFYALRNHKDAQPEIRKAAMLMQAAYSESTPNQVGYAEWHLPLIQPDELGWASVNIETAKQVSAGRCARVSYLTHDGQRDIEKDVQLHDQLVASGHMSPTEHVATPMAPAELAQNEYSGNFKGWHQYRKFLPNEDNYQKILHSSNQINTNNNGQIVNGA